MKAKSELMILESLQPETTQFLLMYILGMIARYFPKDWGEILEGKESGDMYIVQKFLEVTTRKFPNLILNELRNRNFVFASPQIESESERRLSEEQMDRIYDYVNERMGEALRRRRR